MTRRPIAIALTMTAFSMVGSGTVRPVPAEESTARLAEGAGDPAEENKAITRRWFDEVINQRDLSVIPEIYAPDYVHHGPAGAEMRGVEAVRSFAAAILAASDDRHAVVEEQVAEGDRVVTRFTSTGRQTGAFMGRQPTGEVWTTEGIVISRIAGGKIVEDWEIVHHSGVAEPAPPDAGRSSANKELVRRFTEATNAADWPALAEIVADDFRRHSAASSGSPVESRADFIRLQETFLESFPDQRVELRRLVAEGDYVTALATYGGTHSGPLGELPATGRRVESPFLAMFRIADGRIVELWVEWDNLALLDQLGVAAEVPADG